MRECKGCKDRHPACQDSCERFLAAAERRAERKEKIRAAKDKEMLATNTSMKLAEMRRRKYAK